jgi:pyruvate,water dikinase
MRRVTAALGESEWFGITYPGAAITPGHAVPPLGRADLKLHWGLDFHYPRGILPLAHELIAALAVSSRAGAETLPAASGRGLECRVVGPHVYTAGVPVLDPTERERRAASAREQLPRYASEFPRLWGDRVAELDGEFRALRTPDYAAAGLVELHDAFERAVRHFNRAWAIHFEIMYPLLAIAESFRELCQGLGLSGTQAADLIAPSPTTISRADVALRSVAESAREAGLVALFQAESLSLRTLQGAPQARGWLAEFAAFLSQHGERSDAIVDVGSSAWRDDPQQVLALIGDLIRQNADRPTDCRRSEVQVQRDQRRQSIEDALGPADRRIFREALARVTAADFAWWNEDHNAYIDLRAHLPVAQVARELVSRHGGRPTDSLFLFAEEIRRLGDVPLDAEMVRTRREFYEHWRTRRPSLPRSLGTSHPVNDPVLAEIIGIPPERNWDTTVLRGIGLTSGVARGPARVVLSPDDLSKVETGDILVCEATSPSWTVVFPRLAGCVCDAGGLMTHAAIICREYALPCVAGVGEASRVLADGDLLEVDGSMGTVRRLG